MKQMREGCLREIVTSGCGPVSGHLYYKFVHLTNFYWEPSLCQDCARDMDFSQATNGTKPPKQELQEPSHFLTAFL